MQRDEAISRLQGFKKRLEGEVVQAYSQRGSSFGNERFSAWRRQFSKFLDEHMPGESSKLDSKLEHMFFSRGSRETDLDVFWRMDGEVTVSFIDSLILDIQNGEFDFDKPLSPEPTKVAPSTKKPSNKVFIVHGHDDSIKNQVARFLEKLGLEAVILHEQASRGMTIIEKIETYTDVDYAIVLYTPDDKGNTKDEANKGDLKNRGRQNVVFEHGYLIAKLGRGHITPLVSDSIELPSDISGIVYISDTSWQLDVAKEIKSAGLNIDLNKLF